MPWVRFDDQFTIHRKVDGLSDAAFRLHVAAIFWSARNLTDGFVPREDLDLVCARVRSPARFAAECVRRRAWHKSDEACDSDKCPAPVENERPGWVIHDYLEYQPSAQKVGTDRAAKAERQRRWLESKQRRAQDASQDASADAAPPPPRPEGGGAGKPAPKAHANGRASPPGSPARVLEKPPWCGQCDNEHTRYVDIDGKPARCPRCHPLAAQEVI